VKENGDVVEQEGEITSMISNFYKNLFTSNAGGRFDELLQHVPMKVTTDMNNILLAPFTEGGSQARPRYDW
jgi:hypothetical protein